MRPSPQLCLKVELIEVLDYISKPQWWIEQKFDGQRLLLVCDGETIQGYNRRGEPASKAPVLINAIKQLTPALSALPNGYTFILDGEWCQGQYWIFDLPSISNSRVHQELPLHKRRVVLESLFEQMGWAEHPLIRLAPVARTAVEKRALLGWCAEHNAEGVVIKYKAGPYRPGARHPSWRKAKFTETLDCVITEVGREGKQSCRVGLYDENGVLHEDVGAVKMEGTRLRNAHVGDVIEINYLYMTTNLRLYQAFFLRFRDDKAAEECTMDQVKISHKTVRETA